MSQNQRTTKQRSLRPWTILTIAESWNLLLLRKIMAGAYTDICHNQRYKYWTSIDETPQPNSGLFSEDLLILRHLCALFWYLTPPPTEDLMGSSTRSHHFKVLRKIATNIWAFSFKERPPYIS